MSDPPKLHRLSDNRHLTEAQYAAANMLIGKVGELHLTAPAYVTREGLDPAIFLPSNIWAEISKPDSFIHWSYLLTNFARCASPFSGVDMMMWGRRDDGEVDAAVAGAFYDRFFGNSIKPEEMDGELDRLFGLKAKMERSADKLIAEWEKLVDGVPDRFRWSPPPVGGEIGIVHEGRIVNHDLLYYQSRINALYGAGVLEALERVIAAKGAANYLEIGPGSAYFARALRTLLGDKLNVLLIDITSVMASGCAYLSCADGAEAIGLATQDGEALPQAPYVYIASYLVERYRAHLPRFDLAHNAISLNEMNAGQVRYYLDLIAETLTPDGVFYLTAGHRILDYHQDALAAARARFPNQEISKGWRVGEINVIESPNSFFRA